MNQYMEETNGGLVHTYNRFPVVLDHGEGVYLYDTDGKKYLDFAAGIAVSGLGYSNEEWKEAVERADWIIWFIPRICITILPVEKQPDF